jgi:hypothetical protein
VPHATDSPTPEPAALAIDSPTIIVIPTKQPTSIPTQTPVVEPATLDPIEAMAEEMPVKPALDPIEAMVEEMPVTPALDPIEAMVVEMTVKPAALEAAIAALKSGKSLLVVNPTYYWLDFRGPLSKLYSP